MDYLIYGSVDNGTPNMEIFYRTENKEECKKVYEKLLRLSDLSFPTTDTLKDEQEKLLEELSEFGVNVWGEDNADFTIGLAEIKDIKIEELEK